MGSVRTFHIYRYDPDTGEQPRMQTIELQTGGDDRMLLVLAAQRPRRPRGSRTGVWSWVVGLGSGDLRRLELRQEQGTPLGSSSVSW